MIEINVVRHHVDGRTAESVATATIDDDGRVTVSGGNVGAQMLMERYALLQDILSGVEGIGRAIADAQQTTTTRERPGALVVRRPGVMGMGACFAGTRVPAAMLFIHLKSGDGLERFLADDPSVTREVAIATISRAGRLIERDAPLDLREGS